jgi:anti-sigma-K factor RskA
VDLSRADRSARLDALAAAYALGTLAARPRRRLAAVARRDAVVAASLRQWEWRLAALADGAPGITPSPHLWERIRSRLGLANANAAGQRSTTAWWSRLAVWRGLAVAGFALAVLLGISLLTPRERPFETVVVVLAGSDAKPALIATAERGSRFLTVKAVADLGVPRGRALELWMLPDGRPPQSLGLVSATGTGARSAALRRRRHAGKHPGARGEPRACRRVTDRRADRSCPLHGADRADLLTACHRLFADAKSEGPDAPRPALDATGARLGEQAAGTREIRSVASSAA